MFNAQELAVAAKLDTLGAEWGYSPAQLALAWLLSRPAVVSAIVGAGELGELKENAQASDVELSPEQLEILEPIGTNLPDRAATPRRT